VRDFAADKIGVLTHNPTTPCDGSKPEHYKSSLTADEPSNEAETVEFAARHRHPIASSPHMPQ
jgi:hypothetical protein